MKYPAIINSFFAQAWALAPEKFAEISAFLSRKSEGLDVPRSDIDRIVAARRQEAAPSRTPPISGGRRVAILPVLGTLAPRVGMMEEASGGTSMTELSNQLHTWDPLESTCRHASLSIL